MANPNLTRIHQKIFSENAANNGQFGSLQTGTKVETPDISVLQALAAYQEGWSDAVISGEELPSLEEFNGLHKIETEQLQYLLNKGIPEYSADAEYYIGDIQREVGGRKLYRSITDNNIGNALTDTLNWEIYYDPDNSIFDNVTINNKLNTQPNTATISSGAITYTGAYMIIDTEGGAATDNLVTINGGNNGDRLTLRIQDSARNIFLIDGVGNIEMIDNLNLLMDFAVDSVTLIHRDGIWQPIARQLDADFASSKTTNGYTYLPNGLIMQWGSVLNTSTSGTVTYPVTFPNSVFQVIIGNGSGALDTGGTDFAAGLRQGTATTLQFQYSKSTDYMYWYSIGY